MLRRGAVVCSCLLAALSAQVAPAASDDVAAYLERHGLKELLALHLRERLDKAPTEERDTLAVRLAELYAELLETTGDAALRLDLENRARELLSLVPAESADELRLALLRGGYVAAEKIAENHRLRLSSAEDVARALEMLRDLVPKFASLRSVLKDKVETTERRLHRATGAQATLLTQEADRARRLSARCTFLSAWSHYYLAWLEGKPDHARLAFDLFANVIDPEARRLTVDDVSQDLLAIEPMARSVLGLALCRSITHGPDEALRWLALLEQESAHEALRTGVPAWRMAVLLDHRDFRRVRQLIEAERGAADDAPRELPLAWIRLAAAHGLENAAADPDAADLASRSIAELAARGELQQVLDLADRYGVDSMGDSGFAILYVRGARAYKQARDLHGDESPTTRSEVVTLYAQAAGLLQDAQRQPDASRFPIAAAGAQALIGWCLYFQGRFLDARQAFEQAAGLLPPAEAAEALWMAIVSLDRVVRARANPALEADLQGMIKSFRARFPSSEYTPRLVLRGADVTQGEPTPELVEELLAIPPGSPDYDAARRRAEQMLYTLYQSAAGERRVEWADRYLRVALPMLLAVAPDALREGLEAVDPFLVRARRVLEVSLAPGVEQPRAAEAMLGRLDELVAAGVLDVAPIQSELDYRRLRVTTLDGQMDQARAIAERLWSRDEDDAWARAGARAIFKHAVDSWRSIPPQRLADDPQAPGVLIQVVTWGGRALREYEERENALDDPSILASYAVVAEAAHVLFDLTQEKQQGERALFLYEKVLDARPTNAAFLRAVGLLADQFGKTERSIECWRRLSVGLPTETDGWYEAKYHLIRLLATTEPRRAREVMDQHKALYPEYGPPPWRERMQELDRTIVDAGGGGEAMTSDET